MSEKHLNHHIAAFASFTPGKALHLSVRAGFIKQGSSLSEWCKENGYSASSARAALYGMWDGQKGRILRESLLVASGLVPRTALEEVTCEKS
jgi:lambda repressor-like predicted transcriptional regulator